METLDTEEATYIWHVDKSRESLEEKLRSIDQDLNFIRNKGRQKYLASQPENFSRIIHDYSDERTSPPEKRTFRFSHLMWIYHIRSS